MCRPHKRCEQRATPARGPGAVGLTGLLSPPFPFRVLPGTVCTWQTPLTPNVTLALRYSPELAAPVGAAGALGIPQGTSNYGLHGPRCNLCFLCFERCGLQPAVACCDDKLCLSVWPTGNFLSLPSAPCCPVLPREELLKLGRPWHSLCLHTLLLAFEILPSF